MPIVKEAWFVVADSEGARLMQASATKHGGLHIDEIDQLATTFAAGEHHRPSRLSGPGRMAPQGHEHEEKLAHFARELAAWLQRTLVVHAIGSCPVFAPAHLLGALRREAPMTLIRKVRECEGELAGLSPAQLAEHPKVKAALAG